MSDTTMNRVYVDLGEQWPSGQWKRTPKIVVIGPIVDDGDHALLEAFTDEIRAWLRAEGGIGPNPPEHLNAVVTEFDSWPVTIGGQDICQSASQDGSHHCPEPRSNDGVAMDPSLGVRTGRLSTKVSWEFPVPSPKRTLLE